MDRKDLKIDRNSILHLHHCIPNMSDRLLGQTDALDHGRWTKSGAAWAVKSAPVPTTFENSAPTAAGLKTNGGARGSGSNGIGQNANG